MKRNKKSKKKFIITFLCIIIILAIGSYFFYSKTNNKPVRDSYSIIHLAKGNIRKSVETTGEVQPKLEVEIKCKASGEIVKLPVDISDQVKKGQLLLQLDPEDEETSVKQAEVTLSSSDASYKEAKINLKLAEVTLQSEKVRALNTLKFARIKEKKYKAKYDRMKSLRAKNAITANDYEDAVADYVDVQKSLETAKEDVLNIRALELDIDLKKHDIEIAKAKVDLDALDLKLAKQQLAYTTVTAPMDGIVSVKSVQVGQIITSGINDSDGTAVMKLVDMSEMYILACVDESNIGDIKLGQKTNITVDAYPDKKFSGKVVRIATTGVVESDVVRYEVKIKVDKKNLQLLKPMMTANVEIIIAEKNNIPLLPINAVYRQGTQRFVKVANVLGKTKVQYVKTGISGVENIEILGGLSAKDRVVLSEEEEAGNWSKKQSRRRPPGPNMGSMMP